MEYVATQKYLRMSPRKLRLVVDMVKHLTPARAVEILPYVQKRAASPLQKVIKTAIANARQKGVANDENLAFAHIEINQGPRLKRYRAGARGRYKPYTRDMSHIRVVLTDEQKKSAKKTKNEVAVEPEKVEEVKPKTSVKAKKVVTKKVSKKEVKK